MFRKLRINEQYQQNFNNKDYTYRTRQILKEYGGKVIKSIIVCRTPINSVIDKLFNILSFTKWDEMKGKLGYDDLFHLFVIITFTDETQIRLEKNQDITASHSVQIDNNTTTMSANVPRNSYIFLDHLLTATKNLLGAKNYFGYDAWKYNCQNFIYNLLKAGHFLTPQLQQFILQDAQQLLKALPKYTNIITKLTTSAGSYINKFIQNISRGLIGFKNGGLVC